MPYDKINWKTKNQKQHRPHKNRNSPKLVVQKFWFSYFWNDSLKKISETDRNVDFKYS